MKGKTVRRKPKNFRNDIINVPDYILDKNQDLDIEVDIYYTNKLAFFVSLSPVVGIGTVQHIGKRKKENMTHSVVTI